MRLLVAAACSILAACTSGPISVPTDTPLIITEVTPDLAAASTSGPDGQPLPQSGTPLDDDSLNLTLYTIEQQKIDAAVAERELEEARSQLVIVQPGSVPPPVSGANIALYAQQTTNRVGERVYTRSRSGGFGGCSRYSNPDDAQRAFLAAGGPQSDTKNLDPDGDGFACNWDPTAYRQLKI
jgi:hypothetical protein